MEWKRKELKKSAKEVFKKNYWKMVLVSLILSLVCGGVGGSAGGSASESFTTEDASAYEEESIYYDDTYIEEYDSNEVVVEDDGPSVAMIAGIIVGVLIIFLVVIVISFLLAAFIINPLEVGVRRFFVKSYEGDVLIREVAYGYDHSYKNVVRVMFFRDLYTFLWTLLLIIPGIVKFYEYRMIPYIIGNQPDISKEDAFKLSKEMMTGQKWKAFVLDLSFIGWNILSIFTLGMLSVFYVSPYANLTFAGLYRKLSNADARKYTENTLDYFVEY